MDRIPTWLHGLAVASLIVAAICALIIAVDVVRNRQRMWVMNVVWPITALYAGPLAVWAYLRIGRLASRRRAQLARSENETPPAKRKPFWQSVATAVTHCGSGCTLGDLIAEWFVLLVPVSLLGSRIVGTWVLDFAVAFLLGIGFQYFTIQPMRKLPVGKAILAALKADTLSLLAWQIGMYGWMALALFALFSVDVLPKTEPTFWFMMQIAMLCGFLTSYPVNWWLLRHEYKEIM